MSLNRLVALARGNDDFFQCKVLRHDCHIGSEKTQYGATRQKVFVRTTHGVPSQSVVMMLPVSVAGEVARCIRAVLG